MEMEDKCRECWRDIRHNVLNKIVPLGAYARHVSVLIDHTVCGYEEIYRCLDIIQDEVKAVEEFFKKKEREMNK